MVKSSIINYFVKHGKSLLVHTNPKPISEFSCVLNKNSLGKLTAETKASLGDASVWIESLLKSQLPDASAEMSLFFKDLKSVEKMSNRSKGALSIETKLQRGLESSKQFNNIDDANKWIEDGIGTRVITKSLDKLSKSDINSMLEQMQYNGKNLSPQQKSLLLKYIYQKPIKSKSKNEAFRLFEEFARPLVEKRSKEVVDQMTLGILKKRILDGEISIEKIRSQGFFEESLIKRLETEEILPLSVTEINNYRGKYGLSEFSNNQIRQLVNAMNFQKVNGERVKIISDPRGMERYPEKELATAASKFVKKSGYRTAQFNVVHANGGLGEIQFRGKLTNKIAEFEHIAYDLRQGKNTLGAVYKDYAKAILELNDSKYAKYNEYLEACYNYYNRLELGLPAVKPKLPFGFNKILSEESLAMLHNQDTAVQKSLGKDFVPYLSYAA